MALFNYTAKEITVKVVYYGPGLSGKTTNLQYLHHTINSGKKGKLVSLPTESDRTLFFDLLPVNVGKVRDFSLRFQLYTVPGQVRYNATRKLVLKGADAVVFVADSQREMREQNIESFKNMKENLIANNINLEEIPLILQYNKRDLPNILSIQELNKDLNENGKYKYIEAIAIDGTGVEDTFQDINKVTLDDIKHKIDQPYKKKAVQEPGAEETVKGDEVVEARNLSQRCMNLLLNHLRLSLLKRNINTIRFLNYKKNQKRLCLKRNPPPRKRSSLTKWNCRLLC
jgi:signal recognition particle receptor subunit beta